MGGCNFADSVTLEFKFSQAFWDNVWINEGAVLQETSSPDTNNIVTKKFNVKAGSGNMDRVAFYMREDRNTNNENIEPAEGTICFHDDCGTERDLWTIIPSSGNDLTECEVNI